MPRYEVTVRIVQHHNFAVEAETATDAVEAAIGTLGSRDPEHTELEVETNRGVT